MIAKIEGTQQRTNIKGISKKLCCPEHKQRYVLKCQYPSCESPFICLNMQCLQNHRHETCIMVNEFETEDIAQKFSEIDSLISDDTVYQNAKVLKAYIQSLKESIKHVYVGIKSINQNYDFLKGDLEGPLTNEYISKVEESFTLNQTVRKKIQELKDKVQLDFTIKDSYFTLRPQLIEFLTQNIIGMNWSKSQQLYSSKFDLISCEKFHQKLASMRNLLFVFIGENKVVGSYFQGPYPSVYEKIAKDPSSFMFISEKEAKQTNANKFYKFEADSAGFHLAVDAKNYICHGNTPSYGDGIRTFHRNFENIQYSLPSQTFKSQEESFQENFNGTLKVRRFFILQIQIDKTVANNDLEIGHSQKSSNGLTRIKNGTKFGNGIIIENQSQNSN